jgi:hypothetical protein
MLGSCAGLGDFQKERRFQNRPLRVPNFDYEVTASVAQLVPCHVPQRTERCASSVFDGQHVETVIVALYLAILASVEKEASHDVPVG